LAKQEPKAPLDVYETVFTALAHAARRRILMTVKFEGGEMKAGEIAALYAEDPWKNALCFVEAGTTCGG
jgi:hypothetical protein